MASFTPIRGTKAEIEATSIVDGQFLIETDQGTQNKAYLDNGANRIHIGGGGHDMSPDPDGSPAPTEDDVITAIQGAYDDNDNKQVTSLFGVANWSNSKVKRHILKGVPANQNTIGTWQESDDKTEWVTTDWWFIPELKDVIALQQGQNSDEVEIKIAFNPAHEEAISLLGWQLNDDDTRVIDGQTVHGGSICIKMSGHQNICDIALDLVYNYTETTTENYSTLYPTT